MTQNNNTDNERLNAIVQGTRANIVQDILGHPDGAPSLAEINYYNPDKSKSTLRNHLEVLIDVGAVARVKLPEEDRTRDNPSTFYALTEEGWRTLNRHAILLDELEEIRDDHAKVEKSERVEQFEQAPRPDLSRQGRCYVYSGSAD